MTPRDLAFISICLAQAPAAQAWLGRGVNRRCLVTTLAAGEKSTEGLEERYAAFKKALPRQQEVYTSWLTSGAIDGPALQKSAR